MQKVEETRTKRERVSYKTSVKGDKERRRLEDAKLVGEHSPPSASVESCEDVRGGKRQST